MIYVLYGILMIRGAKDPKANAALFDYGILANALHGLVMLVQAFIYPNEHAHVWATSRLRSPCQRSFGSITPIE
jgi:hypothetical protein